MEHATPDRVAARLDAFLSYPAVNPQGEPIPRPEGILPACIAVPLSDLDAGQQAHILQCRVGEPARVALDAQGIRPGARVLVLAASEQSVRRRLADLGLTPGIVLRVVQGDAFGPASRQVWGEWGRFVKSSNSVYYDA